MQARCRPAGTRPYSLLCLQQPRSVCTAARLHTELRPEGLIAPNRQPCNVSVVRFPSSCSPWALLSVPALQVFGAFVSSLLGSSSSLARSFQPTLAPFCSLTAPTLYFALPHSRVNMLCGACYGFSPPYCSTAADTKGQRRNASPLLCQSVTCATTLLRREVAGIAQQSFHCHMQISAVLEHRQANGLALWQCVRVSALASIAAAAAGACAGPC